MAAQRGSGDPVGDGLLLGIEIRAERKGSDSGGQKERTTHTLMVRAETKR